MPLRTSVANTKHHLGFNNYFVNNISWCEFNRKYSEDFLSTKISYSTIYTFGVITYKVQYCSLTKEHPLMKECPPPSFGPISCVGSKFTRMSAHSGAYFVCSLRSTASSTMQHATDNQTMTFNLRVSRRKPLHYENEAIKLSTKLQRK